MKTQDRQHEFEKLLKDTELEIKAEPILLVKAGSYCYGTDNEDSDIDIKGICIPNLDRYFFISEYDRYESSSKDVVIYEFLRFMTLAMKSNLNALNMLFTRDEDVLYMNEFGKAIRDKRHDFITPNVFAFVEGFCQSQINKKNIGRGAKLGRREKTIERFGYDTKYMYHAYLSTCIALDILSFGTYCTYRTLPEREFIRQIRCGEISEKDITDLILSNIDIIKEKKQTANIKPLNEREMKLFSIELLSDFFLKSS